MPGPFGPAWTLGLYVALVMAAVVPAARLTTPPPPPGPCGQWYATASAVGWPDDQWPTVARVMKCESGCDPAAHNRSGASGLMQVMPMWWHGRDPYDPATNLTMALEVWRASGWHAWSCYR